MVCPCLNSRWVISRIKRMLLGCTFLCITSTTVISIFIVLNRTTNHQKVYSIMSYLSSSSGKESEQGAFGTQRPMVQFYPDNQQKHLFPNRDPPPRHFFRAVPVGEYKHHEEMGEHTNKNNYENVLKSKLNPNKTATVTKGLKNDSVSYNVHTFYYAWYANPKIDGEWLHWNHEYIPNWNKQDTRILPTGTHNADKDDIGSNFFPQLGCYSSADDDVISNHMLQIKQAGIGVLVLSWYPPSTADEHGKPVDRLLPKLLDAADKLNLKVALHIEPYKNRSAVTLRKDLEYVVKTYASHRAFYKVKLPGRRKPLPMYYIYDSYITSANEWSRLFSRTGDLSIRDTELDGIFLGLLVEFKHRTDIKNSGLDGFYTYFAANGFSHGSSWKNWRNLNMFAKRSSLLFVPSVGPGYIDTRVRAWNGQTTRHRRKGEYYKLAWRTASSLLPKFISITSFNEWHEGTQIETSIPKKIKDKDNASFSYLSYEPDPPDVYLTMTKTLIQDYLHSMNLNKTIT